MGGKVYLVNPYDSFPPEFKSGKPVFINKSTDTASTPFRSVITDSLGAFNFDFLYADRQYKLHAEMNQNTRWDNNIHFVADYLARPSTGLKLTMQPDTTTQNGLFIVCLDTVKVAPGIIPGDSIFIYTSSVTAAQDTAAITGSGASYHPVANMNGKALKMNLPYDLPLYINAACTYGGKRYMSKLSKTVVRKTGIDTVYIKLKY